MGDENSRSVRDEAANALLNTLLEQIPRELLPHIRRRDLDSLERACRRAVTVGVQPGDVTRRPV